MNKCFESDDAGLKWISGDLPDTYEPDWPEAAWLSAGSDGLGEAYYRLSFELEDPAQLGLAALRLSGQSRSDVWINGVLVKRCIHWVGTYDLDLIPFLKSGKNVLALRAIDREEDAPVLAPLLCLREGAKDCFVTEGWRAKPRSAPSEWTQVWFDDRSWPLANSAAAGNAGTLPRKGPRSLCFKKSFSLDQLPQTAEISVTALGAYELRVNGRPVSDAVLTPGWTEFSCRIEYQSYSVRELLRAGENDIEIVVGNGWWVLHHRGAEAGLDRSLKARCLLQMSFADGSEQAVVSDDSWQFAASPVLMNHLYYGATIDHALAAPESKPVRELPAQAPLVPQAAEPIRVMELVSPKLLRKTAYGSWIIDFGQNLAGWVRLRCPDTAAARLRVDHAELLYPDGSLNKDGLRSANASDTYLNVAAGGEDLEPRFTFHGFRYAEVFGWPGELKAEDLNACFVHADIPQVGDFSCSEPIFNRLFEAMRQTLRSNFHAVPSDCPQRDERLGWMADAGNIPDVAALYFDVSGYFDKWSVDMGDAMRLNGYFPNFAPSMGGSERGNARGTPGWSDAGVRVPWTLYQIYGDEERLRVHYPAMRQHVETMIEESPEHLFAQSGWGDWLAVEASPQEPIGTAYYFLSMRQVAAAARVLGDADDAERYEALLPRIAAAYQEAFFDSDTCQYANGTQSMNAIPLLFGITPNELRPAVLQNLIADIRSHENHLTSGFLGTGFVIEVLAEAGEHDLIYEILTQRDFPSHGRILDAGSTTITEAWNAHLGDDFASHNHFNLGSVSAWFLRNVLGIRPGTHPLRVAPAFPAKLNDARGHWDSPEGRVEVAWFREREGLRMTIQCACEIEIELPGQPAERVAPGAYTRVAEFSNTA